jgi:hypothetical protein
VNVTYIARNGKAGFKSSGTGPLPPPIGGRHIDKTLWLVSQLEMPSGFGSIQNCHDKAVMSAGMLHHIAVVPKQMTQGSLWKLLMRMRSSNSEAVVALYDRLEKKKNWQIGRDGVLRDMKTGAAVTGRAIMNEITQSDDAVVPPPGEPGHAVAKEWAQMFAAAFADSSTYAIQEAFAAEWMLQSYMAEETVGYVRATGEKGITSAIAAHRTDLVPYADLTMAVYHSFSANAPSVAKQCLVEMNSKTGLKPFEWCQALVKKLGTRKYKNWADREDNTSRYDRTRLAAHRSGIWDPATVIAVMPENFRG